MGRYFEMHKHTMFSMFDGFDKIDNIVSYAKELGHKMVGISDHGNACGILQLYNECNKQGLKPLMGVEGYFQPKFKEGSQKFHLCLYAKNAKGYENLCRIISEANEKNFYRTMTITWELLEEYHEGLICSSACVAGFISQAIIKGKNDIALKAIKKFKSIFDDDFYLEIQPITIDDEGTQEKVNEFLLNEGKRLGVKCILTTDSHFTRADDFDSYMMMHKMSKIGSQKGEGFTLEHIEQTYKERYMHSEKEICKKFRRMHGKYSEYPSQGWKMDDLLDAMEEIYDKVNVHLDFSGSIPECDDYEDNEKALKQICIKELKSRGLHNKQYVDRLKYEYSVIKGHGLCDYFLIVREYVQWAKDNNVYVGPGRGSCGGSLVTDLLGITEIDPLVVGTDFDRFLRPDKKKMPDIDMDFENGGQQRVIEHILDKYAGRSSKIATFGYYKVKNLINDLGKVYEISSEEITRIHSIIKKHVPEMAHFEFEDVKYDEVMEDPEVYQIDCQYDGFIKHFCMICGQVKYYGQHPAGVLVTKGDISKWVPLMKVKGKMICSFDKYDVEGVDMVKFDVLGLKTMNVIHEIEEMTGDKFNRRECDPRIMDKMYDKFSKGDTLGIFQLNKSTARSILVDIHADNIQDLIAAISLNRPGTLKLKTHEAYAENKENVDSSTVWYPYTKDAYGSIIYQEHVMRICRGLADMPPARVDKLMKFKFSEEERGHLKEEFIEGAKKVSGIDEETSGKLFDAMALYMFNKGHGAGYALISEWQMYHKLMHPIEFWLASIKWEIDEKTKSMMMSEAVSDGVVIFLPHVNYLAEYGIRKVDGDKVVQMGLSSIKGVGEKAAAFIEDERRKNGIFTSYDNFYDRCKSRSVTSKVIQVLKENGALEFNKNKYIKRVVKYNGALLSRASK